MGVKVFFGSIILLIVLTLTGFAYWFFPILNNFHQAMGGKPLKDPRGDITQQVNDYLSFLPDNTLERAAIVGGIVVGYFILTITATLIALRIRRFRQDRANERTERVRALNAYNARR